MNPFGTKGALIHPCGRVRSAEGLSPHRELSPRSDWRLCRNKGLHPLRRFAAIPAHPQKQYTRRWRLYHFCGFYYPIREVIPIAIYLQKAGWSYFRPWAFPSFNGLSPFYQEMMIFSIRKRDFCGSSSRRRCGTVGKRPSRAALWESGLPSCGKGLSFSIRG